MLRIVPHTVPRVGRSDEHFLDGFELHLLPNADDGTGGEGRGGAEDVGLGAAIAEAGEKPA